MRETIKSVLRPWYRWFGGSRPQAAVAECVQVAAPVPVPLDVNQLLHDQRSAMLREMPREAGEPVGVMLSAGCSGGWYFDWIAQHYGVVRRHIGIEYYMPRPATLPDNVEWIANTCSDMSDVATASCDLVFSGQNIEHLWPAEVAGFLTEAARVTRPGSWLVIDSPNRLMTKPQNWSHPEHTVELTLEEIAELLQLAGFAVIKRAGLWLCRDPADEAILPFDPNLPSPGWSVPERMLAAYDHPADAFLWWVEARRTNVPADAAAIRARIDAIFAAAWPERVQRLIVWPGLHVRRRADGDWIEVPAEHFHVVMYGPGMPLRAGDYRVVFTLATADEVAGIASFDVVAEDGSKVLATGEAAAMATTVALNFTLDRLIFGVQFRCIATGGQAFSLRRGVELEETIRG